MYIYIYIKREIERERERFKKSDSQLWLLKFFNFFELLRDLRNNYYDYFDKE